MGYDAALLRDQFANGFPPASPAPCSPATSLHRYDLTRAVRIVRAMETSATRGAVFDEIKDKNPLYRLVDWAYTKAGARCFQPLLLLVYMLKSSLSVGPLDQDDAAAVSISNFANERHSIDRLIATVPEIQVMRLATKRRHVFQPGQLRSAARMIGAAPRLWPFLASLVRRHSFMPAARIASAVAFYMRFVELFRVRPELAVAMVASNYSPEALGLAAAAHRAGRAVVYINHAPVPANCATIPPVLSDCAIFYGDVVRQTYQRRSRCAAQVALIGQPWVARPMEWRNEVQQVGIFLTALTRAEVVEALVGEISHLNPDARILIRNHPVSLLKCDFSKLVQRYPQLTITIGNPLDEEIAACDLVFCGNSGVAMNVLRGGRPVAYLAALDRLTFDYNGFVETGLVCSVSGWSVDLHVRLKDFYSSPRWHAVMQSYDASYGGDSEELERAAGDMIRAYFKPEAYLNRSAFHG